MKVKWETKSLGEVVNFKRGLTYSKRDEVAFSNNIVLRANNIDLKSNSLIFSDLKYINDDFIVPNNKKVTKGSLLICTASGSKSHLGKVALINNKSNYAFGGFMGQLSPKLNVDSKFLFYLLTSDAYKTFINKLSDGVNINNLRFDTLSEFKIPLPPLPEQKRIVAILDEAFANISRAKEIAEINIKNAREVYTSVCESLFNTDLEDNDELELGELIDILTDYHANGSYKVLKKNVELKCAEDFAWMVRSTDFENNFQNEKRYITKAAYEFLKKSRIFGGEIIMSKIGNAGKIYLMPEITRPCSLAMNLFLIRINRTRASNKYVYRYLKSRRGETQILSKLKGVATQTITKENVRSLRIPMTSIKYQDILVTKLENVEVVAHRLEIIYQQKLASLEELKKSILQKAFAGEL